jgi:hypothetical protein
MYLNALRVNSLGFDERVGRWMVGISSFIAAFFGIPVASQLPWMLGIPLIIVLLAVGIWGLIKLIAPNVK